MWDARARTMRDARDRNRVGGGWVERCNFADVVHRDWKGVGFEWADP